MDDITLVIPAKNEAESLPEVLDELLKYRIKKIIVIPTEDKKTREVIEKFDCKILSQEGKGFGNALIQGINSVETKYFCIFNADGSFNPIYLDELRNKIQLNQDFVFCSRYEVGGGSEDDTILTYIGNKFFTGLCNLLFGLKITDVLFTYVMGSTKAFKELNMSFNDFSFCVELPIKAKKKNYILGNLPSIERSRIAGEKKVNEFRDGFLILMSILKLLILKK
ncbi:glycosyltransferase family 2 protein [Candidatus Pelagibacter sp.]|nr:glycosyltransferase family 2 protein [Candidatus Pelagibacter sp.]